MADDADTTAAVVQELLSGVPAGCTFLRPITESGAVVDFQVVATSGTGTDLLGLGTARRGRRLTQLYPTIAGGPLWSAYLRVLATGEPTTLENFQYNPDTAGIVADSSFVISVHRVLDGLLVWWERVDEARRRLDRTELLGLLGWSEYNLVTGEMDWSPGMYRIFERDPALGPLPRADQSAAVVPEDVPVAELSWQTLDSGATSDVIVRFRIGTGTKHLRILSDLARDPAGKPLKIYAVAQDVSGRERSRSAIEQLSDQLHTREMTALAEHRLAAQLQQLIQPVPGEPFPLNGLRAAVGYLPAESALRVGGDWYHAQTLPGGSVLLAIGDVAGHGLEAANGMAHLRFALVAWLSIGLHDPGELLGHMNRLCVQLGITGTAVIGVFAPPARRLDWARAGHLPPLLGRAGTAAELQPPPGLLLGAAADAQYPAAVAELSPGDLVLLYTDGLVERRSMDVGTHLDWVKAALSAATAAGVGDPLPGLRRLLRRPNPDDDTCTLAVQVV
ncbi:SpoIIE family protein phosphatase [Dactylosporangium vinaceum]|uniref:PP2C family protein-serine/threonine phosphatase n=1 Tax=Dactylosporangium vinaceum TaxID=53362 RepID=A0ABV5M3X4_9ACTN|nr:PP2C family protein-serine/threonine phosphatase [Dactylosporangium vinaceum]UAB93524.1 SpoIIE family protein phosphatase [Dactylosporangium vinaceum]